MFTDAVLHHGPKPTGPEFFWQLPVLRLAVQESFEQKLQTKFAEAGGFGVSKVQQS